MDVVHMSEAEATDNFAALLQHVRNGVEVVIEDGETEIARVAPPVAPAPGQNAEYDVSFSAAVCEGLECDPKMDVGREVIRCDMAARRAETLRKIQEQQG